MNPARIERETPMTNANAASAQHWLRLAAEARRKGEHERRVLGWSPEASFNKARMYVRAARSIRRDTCACCDKPWSEARPFGGGW
jgi:hypothetical protein